MRELPTVAQLIRDYDKHLPASRCSLCNRLTLYRCGEFVACLLCDTTGESRREAGLAGRT